MFFNKNCNSNCERIPPHVHSVEGYTDCAGRCEHKHCFNARVGRVIPRGNSHVHEVDFITDIDECHCHKICGTTGPAIPFGFNDHIHLIEGSTTTNDGHRHCVKVATGTEEPICR